ncbi:ucp1 (predicted) [Pycnogonum litorale]
MVASNHHVNDHIAVKFLGPGTAACLADVATFPLDVAKVRLQIQGESDDKRGKTKSTVHAVGKVGCGLSGTRGLSTAVAAVAPTSGKVQYNGLFGTICTIAKQEGPLSLYNGLIAGLQRQMCFASIRIGFYDHVKHLYADITGTGHGSSGMLFVRILSGITTGGLAVLFAQPTDVVKVRLQAQSSSNGGIRRYNGALHAYKTIAREEGVRGLWKGTLPNVTRNGIVNAAELVCYDTIKDAILSRKLMSDNIPCHFVSGFGAGFMATLVASPVDVVKTRYMNANTGQYKGAVDAAVKMFKESGAKAFL